MFKLRKAIALFLSFVLMIECISPTFLSLNAYAEILIGNGAIISQNEATEEGMADAAGQTATLATHKNNWYIAHNVDRLAYNRFHIEVQNDIVSKSDGNINKELYLKYSECNSVTKKYEGSADLYRMKSNGDYTYIYVWEVKPNSYSHEPNRTKGINQLQSYIDTPKEQVGNKTSDLDVDNLIFKCGGTDEVIINDGETSFYITTETDVAFEDIRYDVKYTNQGNGLIIYDFTRVVERREEKKPAKDDNAEEKPESDSDSDSDSKPDSDQTTYEPTPSDEQEEDDKKDEEDDESKPDDETNTPVVIPNPEADDNNNNDSGDDDLKINDKNNNEYDAEEKPLVAFKPLPNIYAPRRAIWDYISDGVPNNSPELNPSSGTSFDEDGNIVSNGSIIMSAATIASITVSVAVVMTIHSSNEDKTSHSSMIIAVGNKFITETNNAVRTGDSDRLLRAYKELQPYLFIFSPEYDDVSMVADEQLKNFLNKILEFLHANSEDYTEAETAAPPSDPLIIDFGCEGIKLFSLENGVNFDLDNNGFSEKTAWIGTEDAFLALDRNNNGKIDNGSELFGDRFVLKNGSTASSGFEALAEFDTNNDNIIDGGDYIFSKLNVWFDENHNGKSEETELKTLSQVGIKSISLSRVTLELTDRETGTRIAESAEVVFNDAKTTEIVEFWFPVNLANTTRNDDITIGNVPNIQEALQNDETGELTELWNKFCKSDNYVEKRILNKRILYTITNSVSIPSNSRGGNIDARDLHVVEEFMGRKFSGVDGENPNINAANILKNIMLDIEEKYYSVLNLNSSLGGYLSGTFEYKNDDGIKQLNLSALYNFIKSKTAEDISMECLVYDLCDYLKIYDEINNTDISEKNTSYLKENSIYYDNFDTFSDLSYSYAGTTGDDNYRGFNTSDFIYGDAGNDTLRGEAGNDYLDGGSGNDSLNGGNGDDTYVYGKNYGNDTIFDNLGSNTIKFVGLSPDDLTVYYPTNCYDAVLTVKETGHTLTIQGFRTTERQRNFVLEFEEQKMKPEDPNSPFLNVVGKETDEAVLIFYAGSTANALGENDTVTGSAGDDIIYGGDGNDTLRGEAGNDYLDGGSGDDSLNGGNGDDTYVYGKNYGNDTIFDNLGSNTIKFVGLSPDDLTVYYPTNCYDAVLTVKETGHTLTIQGFRTTERQRNFVLEFDGQKMQLDGAGSPFLNVVGKETDEAVLIFYAGSTANALGGNDTVTGSAGDDIIYGGDGNDTLRGEAGNDYLDGGSGDDSLNGGNGDDTYVYGKNYGNDTIFDNLGSNTIKFVGLSPDDLTVYYPTNCYDAVLTVKETGHTLTIQGFRTTERQRNFVLEFEEQKMKPEDPNSPFLNVVGKETDEAVLIFYAGSTANALGGDDKVTGSAGDDIIYGGDGNDTLRGEAGNDYLDGGSGDDSLNGGNGDDTYVYGKNYGNDTIFDNAGSNTIKFVGLSPDDLTVYYPTNCYDAVLTVKETGHTLTIQGFRTTERQRNFVLEFEDGNTIKIDELQHM